ncbi:MAG: zinc-ribbon domain-containing protein [Cyclobacteriaceae bacterium]|nr:zinc-ribbon domain-containing protein [Cyclobacteriaceae bacterium]
MIIYGWNSKNIKQAPLENYECSNCQQKQSVIAIFAKYVHIFWIPVFPYKKTAVIVCTNCKRETEENNIELGTKGAIQQLKSAVPIPKYLFSGLALILIAIGYFSFVGIQNGEKEKAYLSDPKTGDIYFLRREKETNQYNYFIMKVRKVEGDSLWLSYSSFVYNGIVTKLDPRDGFYDIMFSMHKDRLKELDTSGELKKVMRDYSAADGFYQEVEFHESDSTGN